MALLISIFGGMLLTVVVYALARALRLSNFWAAVAGSGIPTVLYLAYAVATTPGLDTITMHVIAYPTVAVMLYLLYGERPGTPEEAAGRSQWIPRFMVVFFLAMTVLYGAFVYIARQGLPPQMAAWLLPNAAGNRVHTGFAGVVAHGEDAAKSIAHHRNMEEKLARLGWNVDVVGLDALRVDHANEVRVEVRDRSGAPVLGLQASLAMGRPGQAPIEHTLLVPQAAAGYAALVGLPGEGAWLAMITLQGQDERIELQHTVGGE